MNGNATDCLKVAVFDYPPFSTITSDGSVLGPLVDLWRYVAIPLNFNWTWVPRGVANFGTKDDNGKWNGIFAYIQNKEVDLLLVNGYAKHDRLEDMEFSSPYTFAYSTIISSSLGICGNATAYSSFPELSMTVMAVLLLTLIVVAILRIVERNLVTKNYSDPSGYFMESFTILLRQPIGKLPSTSGGQLGLGCCLLSFIILINLYLSEMKADMTFCKTPVPETLDDILKNPKARPSISTNIAEFVDMRNSRDSLIRRVWDKVENSKGFIDGYFMQTERIKRILLVEKRCLIGSLEYIENSLTEQCQSKEWNTRIGPEMKVHLSRDKFFLKPVSLIFRLDMDRTLIKKINNRITLFASSGLWLYNERMKNVVLSHCLDSNGRGNLAQDQKTSIKKTFLCTVWGTGILIALISLVVEYIWSIVEKNFTWSNRPYYLPRKYPVAHSLTP